MKINGLEIDVRSFCWTEPGGELHVDIIRLMEQLSIPWSEANERSITRDLIRAFKCWVPHTQVEHVVDRKPPAKPRGN